MKLPPAARTADRLAGEQIIAEIDRPQATDGWAVGDQPTLGRRMLAVLLVGTVLRDDKLRRQGQNAGMTGRHQSGTEKAVEILHLAIRPAAMRALRTVQLARAEMLGAVQGDQHPSTQTAKCGEPIRRLDRPERPIEQRPKMLRRNPVQHLPNVIIGRYRRHAE